MGDVKLPYYVLKSVGVRTLGYWQPTKKMRALGFSAVRCGVDGPSAWAVAALWNDRWQKARRGQVEAARQQWPAGSLGDAFERYQKTSSWASRKPRTREEWHRCWKRIAPYFGQVTPSTVDLEVLDIFYADPKIGLRAVVGDREAHRVLKIWRALWRVAGAMGYCNRDADPSLAIRRVSPRPRSLVWREGEVVRLVKQAVRSGFHGLACIIAVAWDTQLAPIDVRTLTSAHLAASGSRLTFQIDRAKTGRAALGTISRRTERLCRAYLASLGATPHPTAPLFRMRRGAAYNKDLLAKDFRKIRSVLFPDDPRTIGHDMRRSGALEAIAGGANIGAVAAKMANTINSSRELQATYLPVSEVSVRQADDARIRGRRVIR